MGPVPICLKISARTAKRETCQTIILPTHLFSHWSIPFSQTASFIIKGTVSRDFLLQVFSWITFPQAPENNIRVISNFSENLLRYSQVKVHHRCQLHRWQIAAGINNTGGKFATGINNTGGKFCHQFRLCCWHRWQIMGTISGCRHIKVNMKAKIYIYVNSTTLRCPNKIIKIFLLENFFHFPLSCEYLREFSKKFEMAVMRYSLIFINHYNRGRGGISPEKKIKVEALHFSFLRGIFI